MDNPSQGKSSSSSTSVSVETLEKKEEIQETKDPQKTEMSDEDRHRFLAYLMPQLQPLRQACEHNWLSQAGLVALAGFHLYNNPTPGGSITVVVLGITWGTIPNTALDFIFPMVLTYLVIRLGYLLNAYLFIRDGITKSLSSFTNRPLQFQDPNTERMLRANSVVELFCLEYKMANVRPYNAALLILPLILSAIFALNHILSMLFIGRIATYRRGSAIVLGTVLGTAMISCYLHFIFTTNRRGAKFISIATIVFSVVGYWFVHHKMVYGSFW